ncbi:putative n-acetyltransferase b complex non catalytic subunit protein [Phaeoacremonium minimum UCRPA7]|uniref:Putative n-acetyltransferase b complex non catalytic subunit protein n=1 Tax=Phaeoacremonium minimum (strain UCR-PA7) TaxID=1286976 RepID=R8BJN5_PHAM7|nr:putative n-acetyltransferase b complex non catalytic subunit protein [Phaeoacremonium minimum UCRPA7]EON99427.1 putative n-acetyltransferase b complex non catalytic subunit protein [Phaeoacremonium minimum UCRPA7]
MTSYGRYYRPALKNSVDVQLQTAFSDGNWSTVVRLAAKRAQSLKDAYYEAIRACAESQLEGPSERSAAVLALDALVRNPTAVPDVETLDLYEWACRDAQPSLAYSETLGALRSRWVKANPRSVLGIECLKACIQNWDLINAQQIAATLDKASPNTNDRRYMFWNVTLTYLLSISAQCPEGKSRIYGMLATKLVERAAEAAETTGEGNTSDRSLREEEEIILFYHIIEAQAPPETFLKSMRSSSIGALRQLEDGRKYLFLRGLTAFAKRGDWNIIYDFCSQALARTDADGSPSFLAADWRVWKIFVEAASKQPDEQSAFRKVQEMLQKLVSVKSKVAQMYVKNISLASVEFAFRLPTNLLPLSGKDLPTPRVLQICFFLDQHYNKLSVFDDIKDYIGQLSFDETKSLLDVMIPKISEKDALSPLFFDRLSSLSPGLFHGDRRPLMEPLRSYYSSSLKDRAPVKIWDAFAAGSYSAILDMVEYMDRLRRSCTLVMTAVEERRATRAIGGKLDSGIDELPMLSEVTEHATLVNVTDYGSLPNLESSFVPPLADLVRIGPELTNERSHLALLTEQYLDVIDHKPPKDYKPSKANDAALKDTAATIESMARIQQAMSAFLHGEGLMAKLTGPEETYYSSVSLLSAMLLTALTTGRSAAVPPSFALCSSTLKSTIEALQAACVSKGLPSTSRLSTFYALSNHHTLSALRDTALAIKHTVAFMQAFNERESARDRSGKSGLHKEVVAEARVLDTIATRSLAEVRNHIKALKEALGQGGWLDQMTEWTLGTESDDVEVQELWSAVSDIIDTSMLEDWAGRAVESWREGVKGWSTVKLE